MSKLGKVIFFIIAFILISIAIGSIVFGAILLKKSVWIGIGVYLGGEILAGLPFVVIMAIGNRINKKNNNTAQEESEIPDNWWINPPADTSEFHYEVGYAQDPNPDTTKALANVNTALVQYIRNTIDAIMATYANDAGEVSQQENNMMALQAFENLLGLQTLESISRVQYRFQFMPDGGVYSLAVLQIGPLAEDLKEKVNEAFVKNEATEDATRMMLAAIEKYFC